MPKKQCDHTKENSWWAHDAQGIPLCRVCSKCQKERLSRYRPEILSGYTQEDVNEDIEPEPEVSSWHGWECYCAACM